MSLNFPADRSKPYIDPSSGLKYIFNYSSGAWESAIQPPAIISSVPPTDISIPGFLYWDSFDGNLYIYYEDTDGTRQWVQAVPMPEAVGTHMGPLPPLNPKIGQLWWDTTTGRLFVWYEETTLSDGVTPDPNPSYQWVDASPAGIIEDSPPVTVSPVPPENPKIGDLWLNSTTKILYIWYDDETTGLQWIQASAEVTGFVEEVSGNLPVEIIGSVTRPKVTVKYATQITSGVAKFANQAETNAAASSGLILSPGTLKAGIRNYVPEANQVTVGVQKNATQEEVNAGLSETTTVTPKTLANATGLGGIFPGMIVMWGSTTLPTGWVECDGRPSTPYVNLIPFYPTNLPDLRGEFVRGWDNRKGIDPGRSLRSFQGHQLENHAHTYTASDPTQPDTIQWLGRTVTFNFYCIMDQIRTHFPFFISPNTSNPVTGSRGNETRPRNIALMYIIKT